MKCRTLVVALVVLVAAATTSLAEPSFYFHLGAREPGPGPYGVAQRVLGGTMRFFPEDPMRLCVVGALTGAQVEDVDNAHLLPALSYCLLSGSDNSDELNGSDPLSCMPTDGMQFTATPIEDGASQLHAEVTIVGFPTTPGDYTLVAVLDAPAIGSLFASQAAVHLRSSAMLITTGPPRNPDEVYSQHYWVAKRAELDEDWNGELAAATAITQSYSTSVFAWELSGDALAELGRKDEAKIAYQTAINCLLDNSDTRTPFFQDANMREMYLTDIGEALAGLD